MLARKYDEDFLQDRVVVRMAICGIRIRDENTSADLLQMFCLVEVLNHLAEEDRVWTCLDEEGMSHHEDAGL